MPVPAAPPRVRIGTAYDVEAALAVWAATQREASQPPGPARTHRVRAALRSPTSLVLVAGDPVVGMLLAELSDRRLELTMLCVAPAQQRTGVGRALVGALLDRYPVVATWTAQPAVAESLGFTRTGRARDADVELVTGVYGDPA